MSALLNSRQTSGLIKVGNVMIPGDEELPSFSTLGCIEHVDRILKFMPKSDLKDLKLLLTLLGLLPSFAIKLLIRFLEWSPWFPSPLGNIPRLIRLGLKGLVMSLYYSGGKGSRYPKEDPLQVIGYQVGVYTEDLK